MRIKNIKRLPSLANLTVLFFFLASCGGGGGGGGSSGGDNTPSAPAPLISFSADPTAVLLGNSSTLTWSSNNTTSCSGSGAWSGSKSLSGNEEVTISTPGINTFTLSCSGNGGTSSKSVDVEGYRFFKGKSVDGYIRGADIWIDTDNNFEKNENRFTSSDNNGEFEIRFETGNLLSLGGYDLDTNNLLDNFMLSHPLDEYTETKVITPITSLMLGFEDDTKIISSLGIDDSINFQINDPVSLKGDNGVGDYYYEKGNQLTVLSLVIQNIVNNINSSTESSQDYFKAIAEELEKEFTSTSTAVNIESKDFIVNVIDNIISTKSLSISDENKDNLSSILSSTLPILQVKETDSDTVGLFNFFLTTLITDSISASKGEISSNKLEQYINDTLLLISSDQGLNIINITPAITAFDDQLTLDEDTTSTINILTNDDYISSSPISVSIESPQNGLASINNGVVTYTPEDDFNGTDNISYTLTQNTRSSTANINITVNPINDPPSIDTPSTLSVSEGVTEVATIEVSDIDGDEDLTLSLTGTDADSFSLSSERVLSFKEAPVYSEKNEYNITLELSDGNLSVSKDIKILIKNPNTAPQISGNLISEDENIINLENLTLSDPETDQLSVSIEPNVNWSGNTPIGTVDDLDNLETVILGNEDGSPLIITSDLTYAGGQVVKLISDIQLADGVQLWLNNSGGIYSDKSSNFPKIEVRGGKFRCNNSAMRKVEISFIEGNTATTGDITLIGCSWIKGIFARASGNAVYGSINLGQNYLEEINQGSYAYLWYPRGFYFYKNIFYNSGAFNVLFRSEDIINGNGSSNFTGNIFVNNDNLYPSAGSCPFKVYICLSAGYGSRQLASINNVFLNTNIQAFVDNSDSNEFEITSDGDYFGITNTNNVSSRYLDNTDNLSYNAIKIDNPLSSITNSSLINSFQPRLIYDGDYTFSFDVAPDYEALQRNYYYKITFSDDEFSKSEEVTIQINNVTD